MTKESKKSFDTLSVLIIVTIVFLVTMLSWEYFHKDEQQTTNLPPPVEKTLDDKEPPTSLPSDNTENPKLSYRRTTTFWYLDTSQWTDSLVNTVLFIYYFCIIIEDTMTFFYLILCFLTNSRSYGYLYVWSVVDLIVMVYFGSMYNVQLSVLHTLITAP